MSASFEGRRCEDLAKGAPNPLWARNGLARLREAGIDPDRLELGHLERLVGILGVSAAVCSWLTQDPGLLETLSAPEVTSELSRADYVRRLATAAVGPAEPGAFFRRLRISRRRELIRIVAREAQGLAPIDVTAREMSAFAEAAIGEALSWAMESLRENYGEPIGDDGQPNLPCVLGMGKLGGCELNLSSDVDLIFLHRTARGTSSGGRRGVADPRVFFASLVSLVCEALGKVTPQGWVFRVDLDLRPEGRSGELAQAVENAVLYYQSWGQTWERAVLLKARPVAGDLSIGWRFLQEVEPFVFRRSLDYTTVEDFKEMKRRIDTSAARRLGGDDDLKLGRGGIREVEFFVQTLQLIHGGKRPELRERGTLGALGRLAQAGIVQSATSERLCEGYRFLRKLEHAIQALHFRQTHRLPQAPEELSALGRRLGFAAWADPGTKLIEVLDDARTEVHQAYSDLFYGASRAWEKEDPDAEQAREILALEPGDADAEDRLRRAGFRDPPQALEGLQLLRGVRSGVQPSPRARKILDRLGPFLLRAAAQSPDPDRVLLRMGEFLLSSGARASYLSLLAENPHTTRLLITLFGTSDFLSRYLIHHPELLDELVLGSAAVPIKSRAEMEVDLFAAMKRSQDEEEQLDTLRRFRNAEFLRIALNDLWGSLEPPEVSLQLTQVAEVCLECAWRYAFDRLSEKSGVPREANGEPARFAVLGLGKLGGAEIGYHSDLDVLFLYSGSGTTSRPEGGLTNAEFFARLAQRIIGTLATRTREGIAFRMDARLRPSGQAGPLVTALDAFESYHQGGAETWERQALVKCRPVAGDTTLGEAAVLLVRRVLYGAPPRDDPRPEIARMRHRIERELGREKRGRIDLKAGRGGIVDVEFAVQALQLLHGWRSDDMRSPNTLAALSALRRHGILDDDDGRSLEEGYTFLRRVEARLRILYDRATDTLPADLDRLSELARGLGYTGRDATTAFVEDLEVRRERVRQASDRICTGGPS